MKKNSLEYRMKQENNQSKVPNSKITFGSLAGKFPVVLDGGKTTIYISDRSMESETRKNYEIRMNAKSMPFTKKPK